MSQMATASLSVAALPVVLGDELRRIPEVDSAFATTHGENLVIRVFVSRYADDVLDKVFDVEERFITVYHQPITVEVLAKPKSEPITSLFPRMTKLYPL